jgi:hypothetical protein
MYCCVNYTYSCVGSAYCEHHYSTLIQSLLQSFTLFSMAALGQVHSEGHSTLQGAEVMSQRSETGTRLYLENGNLHHIDAQAVAREVRAPRSLRSQCQTRIWVFVSVFGQHCSWGSDPKDSGHTVCSPTLCSLGQWFPTSL